MDTYAIAAFVFKTQRSTSALLVARKSAALVRGPGRYTPQLGSAHFWSGRFMRIIASGFSNDTPTHTTTDEATLEPEELIGRKVQQYFKGYTGLWEGTVDSYANGVFKVLFEDGYVSQDKKQVLESLVPMERTEARPQEPSNSQKNVTKDSPRGAPEPVVTKENVKPSPRTSIQDWTVEDVCAWLPTVARGVLSQYVDTFREQQIAGDTLMYIYRERDHSALTGELGAYCSLWTDCST